MDNSISILIVEDEEIWIESLQLILKELGFSVINIATTIADALMVFSKNDYDVVLMDINLNGKNEGIELGKMVKAVYQKPFIFMTSSGTHTIAEAAKVAPSAYLPKPVNASSLFIAIQNAINNFDNNKAAVYSKEEKSLTSFFVKHGNKFKKIDWKDVVCLTAGKNYITVFNAADKNEYLIRSSLQKTMNSIIPKSLQEDFIQVNRAEVVQFSFISEVMADEVRTDYKNFPISETFSKDLKNRLKIVS